jgi:hypothetical protein
MNFCGKLSEISGSGGCEDVNVDLQVDACVLEERIASIYMVEDHLVKPKFCEIMSSFWFPCFFLYVCC